MKKITKPGQLKQAFTPVVDQIMDIVVKGRKDVPQELLAQADAKELAGRFSFTVLDEPDMGGVMAIVTPKGYDDEYSKKSYSVMKFLFPKAEYIDDSVYGMWQIAEADTPVKLGRFLEQKGFEWETINKADTLASVQVFTFTLRKDEDYGIIASIQPDDQDDIQKRLRVAAYDDCVIGGWTIGGVNTLKETADYLTKHGFVLDEKNQEKKWLPEIKGEAPSSPAAPRKTPPVCPI